MSETGAGRSYGRRRRVNDASGALDAPPGSTVVKFSVVEIREFERVVGDNPSCSSGVPVSIGWNHGKTFTMNLEDFEKARPPRRAQMDLVLTRGERHRLLVEWGASGNDVIEAIRMIIRVKNQRRQTVNNLGSYDRVEEVFENLMRSAKKLVFRNSPNAKARKLKAASERAATLKLMQSSGQATSFTANETLTAYSAPKKGQGNCRSDQALQDTKPPCEEVSVHKDFDTCSNNSDVEETASQPEDASKKPLPFGLPEEFPVGNHSDLRRPPPTDHLESDLSEDFHKSSIQDTYDDVDDMSNPQSHDHHQREAKPRTQGLAAGRTVDI